LRPTHERLVRNDDAPSYVHDQLVGEGKVETQLIAVFTLAAAGARQWLQRRYAVWRRASRRFDLGPGDEGRRSRKFDALVIGFRGALRARYFEWKRLSNTQFNRQRRQRAARSFAGT